MVRAAPPQPGSAMLNPLRSEEEAFRFLLYVIAVIALIIALVLVLRAAL
jgi:flagellar biogenesis protein FliO